MARTRVWQLLRGYRDRRRPTWTPSPDAGPASQLAADHRRGRRTRHQPAAGGRGRRDRARRPDQARAARRRRRAAGDPPYPKELEEHVRLRDGAASRCARSAPRTRRALRDFARIDARRMCGCAFFAPMRELRPRTAARLTQIDYDREMALRRHTWWSRPRRGTFSSPIRTGCGAECAIAVRTDWKGRGLGYALMKRLIEIARE